MGTQVKVAILCPGMMGDVCESSGLLEYRYQLWGHDAQIHWFVWPKYRQPLEHLPLVIREIDPGPDIRVVHAFRAIVKQEGFDQSYITAPRMNMNLVWTVPLPLIPARVLGIKMTGKKWQPQVRLSDKELLEARDFVVDCVPRGFRIMLETQCFSHQGNWTDEMSKELIERAKDRKVVFLTASFGYADKMRELGAERVVGLDPMSYRQLAEVYNHCDMYLGVPSGTASVTCAAGCRDDLPRIEYLEQNRCPQAGKRVPDWGTSSMSAAFAHYSSKKVLDKALSVIHNSSGKRRKRQRRTESRRSRRKARRR